LLVETIDFDYSLNFGEVYHEYRIFSETSDKLPCFRHQIGLVGGARAKIFFVQNSYTDKVIKEFPQIPIGYDAAAKRSVWGNFTPPPTWTTGGLDHLQRCGA
jgi:hypothetical protein